MKSGEETVEFSAAGIILNRTNFPSKPFIKVYGTGTGSVGVGSETISITNLNGYMDIDCEIMDAYKGAVNCNKDVSFTDDIVLHPGENNISFNGGITSIEITPRWYII